MVEKMIGHKVVIDCRSPYVVLGTLEEVGEKFLALRNADLHDLRDTETSRENYVAAALETGIKRNRKQMLLVRDEVVAVALVEDIAED
jgi:hypothetical protein